MEYLNFSSLILYKGELLIIYGLVLLGMYIHVIVIRSINKKKKKKDEEYNKSFLFNKTTHAIATVVTVLSFIAVLFAAEHLKHGIIGIPFILGILGREVVITGLTIKGSTTIIEYILGFFGIVNDVDKDKLGLSLDKEEKTSEKEEEKEDKKEESSPNPKEEPTKEVEVIQPTKIEIQTDNQLRLNYENYIDLDHDMHASLENIHNVLLDYCSNRNKESFLRNYHNIYINLDSLQQKLNNRQAVPIAIVLKMLEIGKKLNEADSIYNEIITDIRRGKQ